MCNINKTEFEEAYKKFPPCKLERFFLKYISLHSVYNTYKYVVFIISILVLPLIFEIIARSIGLSHVCLIFPNLLYAIISSIVGILWSTVLIQKRKRFKKIQQCLGITNEEFKELTEIYFYNRYNNCNDFLIYHSKNK